MKWVITIIIVLIACGLVFYIFDKKRTEKKLGKKITFDEYAEYVKIEQKQQKEDMDRKEEERAKRIYDNELKNIRDVYKKITVKRNFESITYDIQLKKREPIKQHTVFVQKYPRKGIQSLLKQFKNDFSSDDDYYMYGSTQNNLIGLLTERLVTHIFEQYAEDGTKISSDWEVFSRFPVVKVTTTIKKNGIVKTVATTTNFVSYMSIKDAIYKSSISVIGSEIDNQNPNDFYAEAFLQFNTESNVDTNEILELFEQGMSFNMYFVGGASYEQMLQTNITAEYGKLNPTTHYIINPIAKSLDAPTFVKKVLIG
ncbi:MAG: hypothetical protein LBP40_04790 [Campylobacteraceae bacterium]|jgi:hypothetical protein|nr:hypothetical protein [Campylobacteraceae bacterium]